jgi:hypothetical protein
MVLNLCNATYGHSLAFSGTPGVDRKSNIVYSPMGNRDWIHGYGLYGLDGQLITSSGNFIGPQTRLSGQTSHINFRPNEVVDRFDEPAIYVGPITTHYGHFLVTTMSRIWAKYHYDKQGYKYVYHGVETPKELFGCGFIREIFEAFGILEHSLVQFDAPTLINKIVIPFPSFQELSYGFDVFAETFLKIGDYLTKGRSAQITDVPIFLSKNQITSGVSGFINEADFVESLKREGVEIVYPETLSLAEQVALFRSGRLIGGMYGSAFHTSLFSHKNRLVIFNYENKVWTNQIIIDKLCNNEAVYMYDSDASLQEKSERFMNNFVLSDPKELGKTFAEKMFNLNNKEISDQHLEFSKRSVPKYLGGPEIIGVWNQEFTQIKYKFSIVACARWESPYIVEWLNYYRAIGFDHVFLYCNDEEPYGLYEKVLPFVDCEEPFVTFHYYPHQGQQLRMYAHHLSHARNLSEWTSFFDIDEYLRLPPGIKIADFVKKFDCDVDCILFNWVFFGPNGHKDTPGSSILTEYDRRQNVLHPFTKYVARSKIFTGPKLMDVKEGHGFWHCPIDQIDQKIRVFNVLNEDMSDYYKGFPNQSAEYVNEPSRKERILATAVVHHYAFRTEKAFQDRVDRGLGGAFDGQVIWGKIASGDQFSEFLAGLNEVLDDSLTSFWSNYLKRAERTNVFASPTRADGSDYSTVARTRKLGSTVPVSRRKRATQSSISKWSAHPSPDADAAGAVNGLIDGTGKFHTQLEDHPWWQVDLSDLCGITEIRIFNRMEQPAVAERSSKLVIEVGLQTDSLIEVYRRETDEPFGGIDGNPLIFKPTIPIPGRFVRIRLLTRNYLHLDQVEVYGEPLPIAVDRVESGGAVV